MPASLGIVPLRQRFFALNILLTILALSATSSSGAEDSGPVYRLVVDAGAFERRACLVTFDLPRTDRAFTLERAGQPWALQVDYLGRASFVLDHLPLRQGAEFILRASAGTSTAGAVHAASARAEGRNVQLSVHDKPILRYQGETGPLPRPDIAPIYQRGGYLHPVHTPAGKTVTDHYAPNHLHQQGIWFSWTRTEFGGRRPDFWNMGQGSGTVEVTALGQFWSGPIHAGFTSHHRFVDLSRKPSPEVALLEDWDVRAYALPGLTNYWLFDLVSHQRAAGTNALKLLNYHYGGLAYRGPWDWNGKDKAAFLTSESLSDRVRANETRARWIDMTGQVNSGPAGIAILSHPDNFRAPQPLRVHPNEPYLCFAPSQLGDFEIGPGALYASQYRFVIHDGPPDAETLDRLWNDYAHPPSVRIEAADKPAR